MLTEHCHELVDLMSFGAKIAMLKSTCTRGEMLQQLEILLRPFFYPDTFSKNPSNL